MLVLVFEIAGERWGLPAADVREVVRSVAVARLPGAPAAVQGVIDVRGALVPVLDVRARFGMPPRPVDPSESFVLAHDGWRTVALRADRVVELADAGPDALADPKSVVPASGHVRAVARLPGGLVLIQDLRAFLTVAEHDELDDALALAEVAG